MAKLVSELRPTRVEQPILNENDAPTPAVIGFGWFLIAALAVIAIVFVYVAMNAHPSSVVSLN